MQDMKERRLCSPSPFNHAQQKKRTKRLHRGPSRAGQQRRFYTLTHLTSSSTSQPNQNEKRDPPDKTELPRQLSHGTKRTANEIEEATTKHYIAANGLTTEKIRDPTRDGEGGFVGDVEFNSGISIS